MDNYAVPVAPIGANPSSIARSQWQRNLIELTGKSTPNYRRYVSDLLVQSYSEIGAFPHTYHIGGSPCKTHTRQFYSLDVVFLSTPGFSTDLSNIKQLGVSALEFDTKGIYMASATRSGCLTVHDFESLYCQSNESASKEDEAKQLLHITLPNSVDAVRWNPANQDEVACTSLRNDEVHIFDLGYVSSEPTEILRKRRTATVHGESVRKGLSDIAFLNDNSRVLASDTRGAISIWDRRASNLPQTGLTTDVNSPLTSMQLKGDQFVYGANKRGVIYIWDLCGGRASPAFQSHNEVLCSPVTSVKLESMLDKIGPLKAQSHILPMEIESIDINPSCPNQLGFHLDDGWSGVFDMHNFEVTHIHCPPPPWLCNKKSQWTKPTERAQFQGPKMDGISSAITMSCRRKPSWLPTHSIYAVASASSNGIHLLDFYPHPTSPCHVDHDDSKNPEGSLRRKQNKFVPLSGRVTACATHPLNGTIVAGTMEASLLMISQKHLSWKSESDDEDAQARFNTI